MSDDFHVSKSNRMALDGMTSNSASQTERSKGNTNGIAQAGTGSIIDPLTGISRLSLSTTSPSTTFSSTPRQR